jgi:cyclin B
MRKILLDWLVDVHNKFKLLSETFYIAVYVVDKYLEKQSIQRQKFQLLGITALFIASKYEEIYPPNCNEFAEMTDKAFSKKEILEMEGKIIFALDFELTVPSAYRFLEFIKLYFGYSNKNLFLA